MIQDIAPHRLHNQYDPSAVAAGEDYALVFDGGKLLLRTGNPPALPRVKDFPENSRFTYLLALDGVRFFLLSGEIRVPEGFAFADVRGVRSAKQFSQEIMFAILTGKHLADWYRDTRFCGRCGSAMTHSATERAMRCTCGNTVYPRIMPAVIVGVKNGDAMLLTKYRRGVAYNALIAGFTEIGETMEETVQREVMEEAGIRVKNIRYYKSQPWGTANDILLGFYCDVDGDDRITMDPEELKYAEWVQREDIVLQPGEFSLTNEMMKRFKEN